MNKKLLGINFLVEEVSEHEVVGRNSDNKLLQCFSECGKSVDYNENGYR